MRRGRRARRRDERRHGAHDPDRTPDGSHGHRGQARLRGATSVPLSRQRQPLWRDVRRCLVHRRRDLGRHHRGREFRQQPSSSRWSRDIDISFVGMAKSDVRAEAGLDDATIERVAREAEANGKSDFTLDAVVRDADGQQVATTHGLYQLRAQTRLDGRIIGRRAAAASSPDARSGTCTRWGSAADSPGARARPPRSRSPERLR